MAASFDLVPRKPSELARRREKAMRSVQLRPCSPQALWARTEEGEGKASSQPVNGIRSGSCDNENDKNNNKKNDSDNDDDHSNDKNNEYNINQYLTMILVV